MPINDDAYLPYFCFNDIIFPVKTKSLLFNYLFPLVWCAYVDSLYLAVL